MASETWLVLLCAGLLTGCDSRPETAEWQTQCVESHMQMQLIPMTQYNPSTKTTTTHMQQMWISVCDREAPVCVAGKDGSTNCHEHKDQPHDN